MTFDMTVFLVGTVGGALAELLKWWQLKENVSEKLPAYAKSPFYWIWRRSWKALWHKSARRDLGHVIQVGMT